MTLDQTKNAEASQSTQVAAPTKQVKPFEPGSYEMQNHFYPRVLNAQIHPLVRFFMNLGNERIAQRYCHLHPETPYEDILAVLQKESRFFRWGGADLFQTTTDKGIRQTVVIETNSSPSGQKSMPLLEEGQEQAGYRKLLERSFLPAVRKKKSLKGVLAVLHDKNPMETEGYASTLADLAGETVYHVPFYVNDPNPPARFVDGILEIYVKGDWVPVRGALKYVTQRPWTRIPPITKTLIFNPVLCCLAGGRNKLLAAKAYDMFNANHQESGFQIHAPETIWDVSHREIPFWVERMGGFAVVKNPYSNAGQGVWTITNQDELDAFMALEQRYDQFIVQALIGNRNWSSRGSHGSLYHLGTIPNKKKNLFVVDFRFMVGSSPEGFFPVAIYARRARKPLAKDLDGSVHSWEMLGTNLSVKKEDGSWDTESHRLLLMDSRDFNALGLGVDDLVEAYIQSVLAVSAIEDMSARLVTQKGKFRRRLFQSLNPDASLVEEICE